MDTNKLFFDNLQKMERRAAKALVEALLEIEGGCKNPNADDEQMCDTCVFEFGETCMKLLLDAWRGNIKETK